MNVFQRLARRIIESAFELSVATIELFNDMSRLRRKVDTLRRCAAGSLGKEIADILDRRGLTLVPGYESHDLKHALLGFEMTAEGEVRMQAFMIGNGNYSVPSFAIFAFGAVLLPDLWSTFRNDFQEGRNTRPISAWTIDRCASENLASLRATQRSGAEDAAQHDRWPLSHRSKVTSHSGESPWERISYDNLLVIIESVSKTLGRSRDEDGKAGEAAGEPGCEGSAKYVSGESTSRGPSSLDGQRCTRVGGRYG